MGNKLLITKNSKGEIVYGNNYNNYIYLTDMDIIEISKIMNGIIKMFISFNKLKKIPKLPNTVINLYCHHNKLTSLNNILAQNLKELMCDNNNIKQLPDLRELKKLEIVWCDICCFEDYMLEMKNVDFTFFC